MLSKVKNLWRNEDAKTIVEPELADDAIFVEATTHLDWQDALKPLSVLRGPLPGPTAPLLALLRAGHHLVHLDREDDLLNSILGDALGALNAQRGAIILAPDSGGPLQLRALACRNDHVGSQPSFSERVVERCFARGESILCRNVARDTELRSARSIKQGMMSSVICVLLRTPRKRLGALHLDRGPMQPPFTQDDLHLADALAAHVSVGIESAQLLHKQLELSFATIRTLAQVIEMRDAPTGNHTQRVTDLALRLGQQMNLSAADMDLLRLGTPLHDIGKIGIDDAILRKPGPLTAAEFEIMKTHTTKGVTILEQVADLGPIIPIIRSHHERWDGSGYPDKLKGEAIPRLARIVAVADAFDAMTSDRPYRKGLPVAAALAEIKKQSGRQFDPAVAAAFLNLHAASPLVAPNVA